MAAVPGSLVYHQESQKVPPLAATTNDDSDFANGYLVAEIVQKYYPQALNANLFSTGVSLPSKLNNWGQLKLVFQRHHIAIDDASIDAVINM